MNTERDYFKNFAHNQTKIRELDGVAVSALAVGTYLGESTTAVDRMYEEALVHAAQQGINFFDTAINYRCQRSEKNIAYALRRLAGLGIAREQIFISTKGGFLPAEDSAESFKQYILKTYLNSGLITPDDIVENCHCMTPKYLQSQIDLSLNNLKLKTIDLYYLHNPEIQLPHLGEDVFYDRIKLAFEVFEANVASGKIKRYGLATWNGFRQPIGLKDRLDLERVLLCAEAVGGSQHHFRAIQLPYNLAMLEAVAIQNQKAESDVYPVIPAAVKMGLHVTISAPLYQSHIAKLPQAVFEAMPGSGSKFQKALEFVVSSPGVTSAMVGMKSLEHLKENLAVLFEDRYDVQDLQNIVKSCLRAN